MSEGKFRKVVMKCAGHLNHAQGAIVEFAHDEAAKLVGKGWARWATQEEQEKVEASASPASAAPIAKTKAPAAVVQASSAEAK